MHAPITVGLLLVTLILAPAPSALATPQGKQAPAKKPSADSLAGAIVGTWTADVPTPNGAPVHMQVIFKSDGTETQVLEGKGRKINQWIKYSVANGWLTQTLVRSEQNGKPFKPSSPSQKKLKARVKGDTLYLTMSAQAPGEFQLHRVKK